MKVVSVVGARPQFIKAAMLTRAMHASARCDSVLVHTGQHYDDSMSGRFFRELELPTPDYELGVGSASHNAQTAAMLLGLERVLLEVQPDLVVVYGDTNSTLAGSLAAAKLRIPLAHVEAGLRSFRRDMPEEINRVVTDHVSDLLFAPTLAAIANLAAEGLATGAYHVGDVMLDALLDAMPLVEQSDVLQRLECIAGEYAVATIHRAANTDESERLLRILHGFGRLPAPIVFPVHPRTRAALEGYCDAVPANCRLVPPVGYVDMLALQRHARCVMTDSGGVQKEAYTLGVPCLTLREETEWVETLEDGWNVLVGCDADLLVKAWARARPTRPTSRVFGTGDAARRIVDIIEHVEEVPARAAARVAGGRP